MPDPQDRRMSPSTDAAPAPGQTLLAQRGNAAPASDFPAATLAPFAAAIGSAPAVMVQRIAGYEILSELGRGGMGVVYKARQQGLRHEGIVQVYEVGDHQGKPFFSLEYVEGGSLDKRLAGTPLQPREAARLVQQLADAMQAAHEAGIIHRDLKPANVLLVVGQAAGLPPDDRPVACPTTKITDFGLAKKQDEGGLSVSGAVMGTPSYMASEQAEGKVHAIDARTDVWALGAILYECLTGRAPFKAATAMDTIIQVATEEPVSVGSLQPSVPDDLGTVCLKAMSLRPQDRYATAKDLADDLEHWLADEPVEVYREPLRQRLGRWRRLPWRGRRTEATG